MGRLNKEEKQRLKIVIKVQDGCTENKIKNIKEILDYFKKGMDKMNGTQIFILLALAMGGYLGNNYISAYFGHKEKQLTTKNTIEKTIDSVGYRNLKNDNRAFEKKLNNCISSSDTFYLNDRQIVSTEQPKEHKEKPLRHAQLNGNYRVSR